MTTIKASCPSCGEVELTHVEVRLQVCSHAPLSYYAFDCPGCVSEVRKPADAHVISLLMSGGVKADLWEIPLEALETHDGPDIDYDDVLDFAMALESCADLVAVARAVRQV
jgi:hypothetical protein